MNSHRLLSLLVPTLVATSALAAAPYAGQQTRDVKALSADEVSALLDGKGMGFARAAELNGFAGPAHVLELATELQLTDEQRTRTHALFAAMSASAIVAGRLLVDKERELDRLFATKAISPYRLASELQQIGGLQARVREVHLQAHLAQVEILTAEQNARYGQLRGYAATPEQREHEHRH